MKVTARIAPAWMATLNRSDRAPSQRSAMSRWPVLDMGRNSVIPSTIPRRMALISSFTRGTFRWETAPYFSRSGSRRAPAPVTPRCPSGSAPCARHVLARNQGPCGAGPQNMSRAGRAPTCMGLYLGFLSFRKIQRLGEVAGRRSARRDHRFLAHRQARQPVQPEAARDEAGDGAGVVHRVFDMAFLRERRNHQRRNSRTRTPAIAAGWRHVVPPAAVLVESDDHQHVLPLLALAQVVHDGRDVAVAGFHVRVAGMHVEIALRLCV